jgi:hypothetical protein
MVPANAFGVVLFFLFVIPGTCYELLRGRTQLPAEESAFVHVSRILTVGALVTASTAALLAGAGALAPSTLANLPRLLSNGAAYFSDDPGLVTKTLALQLLVSLLLAAGVSDLRASTRSIQIHRGTALFGVTEAMITETQKPYLRVHFKSGRQVAGHYFGATTETEPSKREVILQPPALKSREPEAGDVNLWAEHWERLVVFCGDVEYITVGYVGPSSDDQQPSKFRKVCAWVAGNYLRYWVCFPACFIVLVAVVVAGRM